MNNKGFTLLEMLAVVSIMTVVTAVSIPVYTSYVEKAEMKKTLGLQLQHMQTQKLAFPKIAKAKVYHTK